MHQNSSKGSGFSPDAGNATTRYLSEATPQFFALLICSALGVIDGHEGLSVVTATKGKRLVVDAVDRGSLTRVELARKPAAVVAAVSSLFQITAWTLQFPLPGTKKAITRLPPTVAIIGS